MLSLIGADHDTRFRSVVTSYDYNAPLSEAGDPTDKLLAIRDVIRNVRTCLQYILNVHVCRCTCMTVSNLK